MKVFQRSLGTKTLPLRRAGGFHDIEQASSPTHPELSADSRAAKQGFGSVRVCSRHFNIHVFVFEPRGISCDQAAARSQEGIAQDTEHPCADILPS